MKPIARNTFLDNIIPCEDLTEITSIVAKTFADTVLDDYYSNVVLPVGRTQYELYDWIVENEGRLKEAARQIHYIQLDEYLGVPNPEDPRLLFQTLRTRLLDPIGHNSDLQTTFRLHAGPERAAHDIESTIAYTKIDLAILGMGANGHIGFNEPGSTHDSPTRVVDLDEKTRRQNAELWGGLENVPRQAITLGLGTLRRAHQTVVMVSGEEKAEAMDRFIKSKSFDPDLPASYLRLCQGRVTILADRAAMGVHF